MSAGAMGMPQGMGMDEKINDIYKDTDCLIDMMGEHDDESDHNHERTHEGIRKLKCGQQKIKKGVHELMSKEHYVEHEGYGNGGMMAGGLAMIFLVVAFLVVLLAWIFRRGDRDGCGDYTRINGYSNLHGDESSHEVDRHLTTQINRSEIDLKNEAERTRNEIREEFRRRDSEDKRRDDREHLRLVVENERLKGWSRRCWDDDGCLAGAR